MALSRYDEYWILTRLCKDFDNSTEIERLISIMAYCNLVKSVPERNLLNIMTYAAVDLEREFVRNALVFGIRYNIFSIMDEELGFYKSLARRKIDKSRLTKDEVSTARKAIKDARRRLLNG